MDLILQFNVCLQSRVRQLLGDVDACYRVKPVLYDGCEMVETIRSELRKCNIATRAAELNGLWKLLVGKVDLSSIYDIIPAILYVNEMRNSYNIIFEIQRPLFDSYHANEIRSGEMIDVKSAISYFRGEHKPYDIKDFTRILTLYKHGKLDLESDNDFYSLKDIDTSLCKYPYQVRELLCCDECDPRNPIELDLSSLSLESKFRICLQARIYTSLQNKARLEWLYYSVPNVILSNDERLYLLDVLTSYASEASAELDSFWSNVEPNIMPIVNYSVCRYLGLDYSGYPVIPSILEYTPEIIHICEAVMVHVLYDLFERKFSNQINDTIDGDVEELSLSDILIAVDFYRQDCYLRFVDCVNIVDDYVKGNLRPRPDIDLRWVENITYSKIHSALEVSDCVEILGGEYTWNLTQ